MNFIQSVKTCFKKYASFQGRATRSEFWWFQLFMTVMSFGAMAADGFVLGYSLEAPFTPLAFIVTLGLTIPSASVTARRLHDIGWSGWVQMPMFLTFTAYLDVWVLDFSVSTLGVFLFSGGVVYWLFLCLILIKDSQPLTNRYGPNPKAENLPEIFS